MIPVPAKDPGALVDTCGTGGGAVTTFNVSTAAALVAAGAGVRIAKHGNRSFTSRSGSADVLEALGVRITLSPEGMGRVLEETGIVFMFAPLLHPAMRHVGPVRKELGIPTIMNLLGPLTNPAGVRRQVVGVSDPGLIPLVVEALRTLGHIRALVVHGEPGMDEVSPLGPTRAAELVGGTVRDVEIRPEELGLPLASEGEIRGGTPEENAALIEGIVGGSIRGGALTVTLLNAAAALLVADAVPSLREGVVKARGSVESGAARGALEALRRATAEEEGRAA
jgi:anthranilate phosphoribosyltransferase